MEQTTFTVCRTNDNIKRSIFFAWLCPPSAELCALFVYVMVVEGGGVVLISPSVISLFMKSQFLYTCNQMEDVTVGYCLSVLLIYV